MDKNVDDLKLHTRADVESLAKWLHFQIASTQNLPSEDGDICDDCIETVRRDLVPFFQKASGEYQTAIRDLLAILKHFESGQAGWSVKEVTRLAEIRKMVNS